MQVAFRRLPLLSRLSALIVWLLLNPQSLSYQNRALCCGTLTENTLQTIWTKWHKEVKQMFTSMNSPWQLPPWGGRPAGQWDYMQFTLPTTLWGLEQSLGTISPCVAFSLHNADLSTVGNTVALVVRFHLLVTPGGTSSTPLNAALVMLWHKTLNLLLLFLFLF